MNQQASSSPPMCSRRGCHRVARYQWSARASSGAVHVSYLCWVHYERARWDIRLLYRPLTERGTDAH